MTETLNQEQWVAARKEANALARFAQTPDQFALACCFLMLEAETDALRAQIQEQADVLAAKDAQIAEATGRIEALEKQNHRLTGPNSIWYMYITLRAEVQKTNKAIARRNQRIACLKQVSGGYCKECGWAFRVPLFEGDGTECLNCNRDAARRAAQKQAEATQGDKEKPKVFATVGEMAAAWKVESAALIESSRRSEQITGEDLQTRVGPCDPPKPSRIR